MCAIIVNTEYWSNYSKNFEPTWLLSLLLDNLFAIGWNASVVPCTYVMIPAMDDLKLDKKSLML